jgi:hypothetical protein
MKPKTPWKPRPIRKKKTARRGVQASRARRTGKVAKPDSAAAMVAGAAQALAVPVDPAWRENIEFNVRLILRHAALVDEFALPDDSEPAPVFHA